MTRVLWLTSAIIPLAQPAIHRGCVSRQASSVPVAHRVRVRASQAGAFWKSLGDGDVRRPPKRYLDNILAEPWRGGLEPISDISPYAPEVSGKIPEDLEGSLLRNGPGRIRVGDNLYGHWFDGDGLVSRITLDPKTNSATFSAKYVRTDRFKAQERTHMDDGFEKRGAWTNRKGGFLGNIFQLPTNPANTAVICWEEKVLALCEGGPPIEISGDSLETIGEYRIPGLPENSFFSAHPKIDPETGILYNIGLVLGQPPKLRVFKIVEGDGVEKSVDIPLEELGFIHDFAISNNHIILLLNPWTASVCGTVNSVFGGEALGRQFKWNPERASRAVIIRKNDLKPIADFKIPSMTFDHVINAYEVKDDIRVQLLRHRPNAYTTLEQNRWDLYSGGFSRSVMPEPYEISLVMRDGEGSFKGFREITDIECELPRINPEFVGRAARYAYVNTKKQDNKKPINFLNAIAKVDLVTGETVMKEFGEGLYAGEPVFVNRQAATEEDDGYLLTYVYDSNIHRTKIVISDPRALEGPSIAEIKLHHHVPFSFHGTFVRS
ncbi:hypothetical protein AAMO2058_001732300 [Amorphochlora amoebiformis]